MADRGIVPDGFRRRAVALVLTIFVSVSQILGTQAWFEIEHCHVQHVQPSDPADPDAPYSLGYTNCAFHIHTAGPNALHLQGSPADAGSDSHEDRGSSEHSGSCHSHIVVLPLDLPWLHSDSSLSIDPRLSTRSRSESIASKCPDGPCFDLIKPPQLV